MAVRHVTFHFKQKLITEVGGHDGSYYTSAQSRHEWRSNFRHALLTLTSS